MSAQIFQIFFNDETKRALDPGFIPLDNQANPRPEWYEFWVIREYLHTHPLNEADWYGFVSTKFQFKTGLSAELVHKLLQQQQAQADVLLFSPAWDQIAYFQNAFEQGEYWHPGLIASTQAYLKSIHDPRDVRAMVGHGLNTVFSNFVVAKPRFWQRWLVLADALYDFVEGECAGNSAARGQISYGSVQNQAPMRAFLQERLACLVLQEAGYRVLAADLSRHTPLFDAIFLNVPSNYELLRQCDLSKQQFHATGNREFLLQYQALRRQVQLAPGAG